LTPAADPGSAFGQQPPPFPLTTQHLPSASSHPTARAGLCSQSEKYLLGPAMRLCGPKQSRQGHTGARGERMAQNRWQEQARVSLVTTVPAPNKTGAARSEDRRHKPHDPSEGSWPAGMPSTPVQEGQPSKEQLEPPALGQSKL